MAANEVEKKVEETKTETESTFKRLTKIAEFRMVLYIVPVAIILLILALTLKAN